MRNHVIDDNVTSHIQSHLTMQTLLIYSSHFITIDILKSSLELGT